MPQIPNLEWYAGKSAAAKLSPRCPIARSELCPRYYASFWLLGQAGVTTQVGHADQVRLDKKWEPFKPVVAEEEPNVIQVNGEFRSLVTFAPRSATRSLASLLRTCTVTPTRSIATSSMPV